MRSPYNHASIPGPPQCGRTGGVPGHPSVACTKPSVVVCAFCRGGACAEPWHVYAKFMTYGGGSSYDEGAAFFYHCETCQQLVCPACIGIEGTHPGQSENLEENQFLCPACWEQIKVMRAVEANYEGAAQMLLMWCEAKSLFEGARQASTREEERQRAGTKQKIEETDSTNYTTRRGVYVGGYELGEILGRGGFSSVYETWLDWAEPEEQRDVCIKVGYPGGGGAGRVTRLFGGGASKSSQGLRPDEVCDEGLFMHAGGIRCGSVSGEDVRTIFSTEYAFLESFDTHLLPKVFAAGEQDGVPYYVMERFRGHNLRDWRYRGGRLHEVRWFKHLLSDLTGLQNSRPDFYHGDLKPENLIILRDGFRLIDPALRPDVTRPLRTTISVAYNPLGLGDERADTLAIAVMLFELLTGVQPFVGFRSPWCATPAKAQAGRDEYERARAWFLNLERFASFRSDGFYRQLLGWMESPPRYKEMLQTLELHAETANEKNTFPS